MKNQNGKSKTDPPREEELQRKIADWQSRRESLRHELTAVEAEIADSEKEMETYLLAAAGGNAEAERQLSEIERDLASADAHRRRIAATIKKIESEVERLELEKNKALRFSAAARMQNRMAEVKSVNEEIWQAYQVIESSIAKLWELTRCDQVDGAALGLNNMNSRRLIQNWNVIEFMDRLRAHADKNGPLPHEDFLKALPDMVRDSQQSLVMDINLALTRFGVPHSESEPIESVV